MNRLPSQFFSMPPSPRTDSVTSSPFTDGRPHHAGRVELHELHVHQRRRPARSASAWPSPVYSHEFDVTLNDFPIAAGGQDDRRRLDGDEPAGLAPVAEAPRRSDRLAVQQQLGDGALHEHVDADLDAALLQGADHLQTGAVADVGQARVAVPAEVALADQPVLGAVEDRAPLLELDHPLGRLLGVELGHPPVVEDLAAAHGVAEVDLPVVLGRPVAHGGGDAALGHHGVRLAEQRLADDRGLRAGLVGGDRRTQPRAAGADDDDVVGVPLHPALGVVGHLVAGHRVAGRWSRS